MISLTDINGRAVLLAPDQIASVTQAGASQAWHGVRANVQKAVDGKWIEVRESVDDIERQVNEQFEQVREERLRRLQRDVP